MADRIADLASDELFLIAGTVRAGAAEVIHHLLFRHEYFPFRWKNRGVLMRNLGSEAAAAASLGDRLSSLVCHARKTEITARHPPVPAVDPHGNALGVCGRRWPWSVRGLR